MEIRNLTLQPSDPFGVDLRNVNIALRPGEILGIAGVSGNGQKELASVLSGETVLPSAERHRILIDDAPVGHKNAGQRRALGFAFVPEERNGRGAVPGMTLVKNTILTSHSKGLVQQGFIRLAAATEMAEACVENMDVRCQGANAEAKSLSGGNLQKFIVGREIMLRPKIFVAAQPTWGVDVGAAAAIRQQLVRLRDEGVALLIISDELEELLDVADRIQVIFRGRVSPSLSRSDATTSTIAAYCTVHRASAEAFFTEAQSSGMLVIGGKVMMDRNAPDGLKDTPRSGYDDTKALIAEWHGKNRLHYAITPRFAITSTPEQMEMVHALVEEYPNLHVQTHLSENQAEIALTRKLYPSAKDYTDVYARYGLLGPKTILGHCIHLSDREADALSESRSVAAFCPTSNLFLGSGLFDWQRYLTRAKPLRIAAATDIGGGTSYSMLATMDEAYKILAVQGQKCNPLASFWQITLGNAEALSLQHRIGTLDPGPMPI